MDKLKKILSILHFSPWAVLATWLHEEAPQNIQGKMNSIPVLNKTSPRAQLESKLDMLGILGKLVKYVVHSSKRKY
jgi:hypothetical protein